MPQFQPVLRPFCLAIVQISLKEILTQLQIYTKYSENKHLTSKKIFENDYPFLIV